MVSNNPLLRSNQNKLVADLNRKWQHGLTKVWHEDGQLFNSLSTSFSIHESIADFSDKLFDHASISRGELQISEKNDAKRRELLKDPAEFFYLLITCHDYSEINDAHRGIPNDFPPEHFAWATGILLNKFFRGKKENLDTLMEHLDDLENHEKYQKALLEALDKSKEYQNKLKETIEKQEAFADRLKDDSNPISDFEFLNNVYGLGHLNDRDKDVDARINYLQSNDVVNAYLNYLEDESVIDSQLPEVYEHIIQFTNFTNSTLKPLAFPPEQMMELPLQCRIDSYDKIVEAELTAEIKAEHKILFRQAFEYNLFELEKSMQSRLNELRKASEGDPLLKSLSKIEKKAIIDSLKLIATYRYTKADQAQITQVYQKFNVFFRDLLEGKINELEFEAKLNHLISKYAVGSNVWNKIKTYVKAIIEYITGKDKRLLPAIVHVKDLREYTQKFSSDFIKYLDGLSAAAKARFVQDYADKLVERFAELNSESHEYDAYDEDQNISLSESADSEDDKKGAKSASESTSENNSSQVPIKYAPLIKSFRSFTGEGAIEDILSQARELESHLMSASLEAG